MRKPAILDGHKGRPYIAKEPKLVSSNRMMRVWNRDWDVPGLGDVLMDKITFTE
ncbi:MAG: hypothetical protein LKE41_07680 [Prevotella sp.]|nr:hypothetical protein [Prevotella sp.]